jgi:serine/threonine protein kinase/WD40 repeat protein
MPSPQDREAALFALAAEKPAAERAAFLDGACHDNSALRQRLEALLAAHEQPDTLLATEAGAARPTVKLEFAEEPPDEAVGQTLGRYKLLERVGEGGCGVVYVAEQTEPVRRRVALKVIKLGMDTKQVVARFEAERQALAMMDHPNIAKVLDAGTTDLGRPFFVMELVRGIPITAYCDQASLSTKERLDLFIKVCQAIQHAHQKGIIHRDIKPSNILVTLHDGVPVPKVIDFGIAKATEGRLTDNTVYTQLHQFIGTPAYMSPEQAEMSGLDIDTRSDIYSLGVLLYELLAGSTPFDAKELMASGIDAMRKTIREKEPQRPSTKLTMELTRLGSAPAPGAVTGAPRVTPGAAPRGRGPATPEAGVVPTEEEVRASSRRLLRVKETIHQLKGDLDWIVMKCLEKDRQRRYESANGLAADLKRHLNNEPVLARPPSAAYKFHKAWRRNKLAFAAGTAVFAALVVGLGLTLWQYAGKSRAEREQVTLRQRAEQTAAEASKAREQTAQQRDLAQERLYGSLVREAQAIRKNRQVGYRREVFDRLKQAMALGLTNANSRQLRREATASLGDWVALDPVDIEFSGETGSGALTPDGTLAALARFRTNLVSLRETRTGRELALLSIGNTGETAQELIFDQRGLTLFVAVRIGRFVEGERFKPMTLERWSGRSDGSWQRDWSRPVGGVVQFAPTDDGPVALVVDPSDTHVAVIDLDQNKEVNRLPIQSPMPWYLAVGISVDRKQLAFFSQATAGSSGRFDLRLEVWDLATGKRRMELSPKLGYGIGLRFSQDGKILLASCENAVVGYDTKEFNPVFTMTAATQQEAVMGSGAGLMALPINQELSVRLVSPVTGREVAVLRQSGVPISQFFSRDGSLLMLSHTRGARIVRLKAEREKRSLEGHQNGVPVVEFSPDGTYLVSAGKDRTLRWWNLKAGGESKILGELPAPGQTVAFTPDGEFLVCGYYNTSELSIWSTKTWERIRTIPEQTNHLGTTWACSVSPDGQRLATIGSGLRVWDMAKITRPSSGPEPTDAPLLTENNCWGSVAFSPNGTQLAYKSEVAGGGYGVKVRSLVGSSAPTVISTNAPTFPVQVLGFLPNSGALAQVTRERRVEILEPATGRLLREFATIEPGESLGTFVANLRVSPNESKLAMVSVSGLGVDLWNPATGQLLYSLPEEAGAIWWLAWSPDSQQLAVSRANGEIALWNLKEVEAQLAELGLQP